MWKSIVDWFKGIFQSKDSLASKAPPNPIPAPAKKEEAVYSPPEEQVVIRRDDRQGWENLIEVIAKDNTRTLDMKIAALSQFILESARGTSRLALDYCNYGGIKFRPELEKIAVPVGYKAHDGLDTYAQFEGDAAFWEGYWIFISRSPYKGYEKFAHDKLGYIQHLKACGYAESPDYVAKVSALFGEARSLLERALKELELPIEVPKQPVPAPHDDPFNHLNHKYEMPTIVNVNIKTIIGHGGYSTSSGRAKGHVQHYTAGAIAPDSRQVISMLTSLGNRQGRLGCYGMDEEGVIYIPTSLGFTQKGYHAGNSRWRGVDGMNSYLMGIEVCNPGKLVKAGNEYFPYYQVVNGKVKPGAKAVDPARVRVWSKDQPTAMKRPDLQKGYQSRGVYMAFTAKQEKALINFALMQLQVNPAYSIDWVVGHDEISGSGKSDPGACLSLTMPEWRNMLSIVAQKNGIKVR